MHRDIALALGTAAVHVSIVSSAVNMDTFTGGRAQPMRECLAGNGDGGLVGASQPVHPMRGGGGWGPCQHCPW